MPPMFEKGTGCCAVLDRWVDQISRTVRTLWDHWYDLEVGEWYILRMAPRRRRGLTKEASDSRERYGCRDFHPYVDKEVDYRGTIGIRHVAVPFLDSNRRPCEELGEDIGRTRGIRAV